MLLQRGLMIKVLRWGAICQDKSPINIQANIFSEEVPYDRRLSIRLTEPSEQNAFAFEYFCNQINYLQDRLPQLTDTQLEKIIVNAGQE